MLTRNVVLAAALLSGQMVPSGAIRACDGGFSEPALPAEARDPFDRTWIKTGASIYLAIPGRGVFQARLDSNALEPLGVHRGFVDDLHVSFGGRYLIYSVLQSPREIGRWIYDLRNRGEHELIGIAPYSLMDISPNDRWIAVAARPGGDTSMTFIDLKSNRSTKFPIAGNGDVPPNIFSVNWSLDSDLLVFGLRDDGRDAFWGIAPQSGQLVAVQVRKDGLRRPVAYTQAGRQPKPLACAFLCGARLSEMPVFGGYVVSSTAERLTLRRPGAPDKTIASAPSQKPPAPATQSQHAGPTVSRCLTCLTSGMSSTGTTACL